MPELTLTFFGVRGSYPVSARQFDTYGGNTSSLLFETSDTLIIFDAGTGIINAGRHLLGERSDLKKITIFLTHLHIDHIIGLPFFAPVFNSEYEIDIYCPAYPGISLPSTIHSLFLPPLSPITLDGIKARFRFHDIPLNQSNRFGFAPDLQVESIDHNDHPLLGVMMYKLSFRGKKIVFATDIESPAGFNDRLTSFIQGADILIHDSQYLEKDYNHPQYPKKGYGHSTVSMATHNAFQCQVGELYLFHFDPEYSDQTLEIMLQEARQSFKNSHLSQESIKIKLRS
jgi:ribonuclease BN (tRNA processing enzyme)